MQVDWCIVAGLLLNVATKGSIGVFETMGVGIAINRFALSPAEVGLSQSDLPVRLSASIG